MKSLHEKCTFCTLERVTVENTGVYSMEKSERIQSEIDKIKLQFKDVPIKQRAVIDPLLQNYGFMKVTLEDLQEEIIHDGLAEVYHNGRNQSGMKENSKLKSYNRLIKNFESVCKTLMKCLPDDGGRNQDAFEKLLKKFDV